MHLPLGAYPGSKTTKLFEVIMERASGLFGSRSLALLLWTYDVHDAIELIVYYVVRDYKLRGQSDRGVVPDHADDGHEAGSRLVTTHSASRCSSPQTSDDASV